MSERWRFIWLIVLAVILVSGADWLSSNPRTAAQKSIEQAVAHFESARRLLDEIK